jgi:hypothetical protein
MIRASGIHEASSAADRAQKLRFGIMCRGVMFPAWQAAVIRHLAASGLAEPILLIVDRDDRAHKAQGFGTLLYRLYERYCELPRLRALRPLDLGSELDHLPVIHSQTFQDHSGTRCFRVEDVEHIRSYRLDFILHFAFPHIAGDVLTASRFGVWSYSHDGDGHGARTAFWAYRQRLSGLPRTLTRLAVPQPQPLHAGSFRAGASCARSLDSALFGSADWCERLCRQLFLDLQEGRAPLPIPPAPLASSRLPGNNDFLHFLARRASLLILATLRRYFFLEYWNIGIIDAAIERVITDGEARSVRWLAPPRPLHYHADPFALPEQPDSILFEEYSHVTGVGWISSMPLTGVQCSPRRVAFFDQGSHRSYPFLFCAEGETFCVPESASDRRVDLYRAVRFPDLWQHARTLIEGFPALDSSIFFHGGRWWLLCTSGEEGGEHQLYAWHAAALLGPWTPHPLNPLKCDVSSTRPAGRPFLLDGSLFRPAQDCAQTYGGAIVINRIIALTPTEFVEEPIGRIEPAADSDYRHGLHTVCPFGDMTIIDGKRFVFDIRAPYLKAKHAPPSFTAKSFTRSVLSLLGERFPR